MDYGLADHINTADNTTPKSSQSQHKAKKPLPNKDILYTGPGEK